MTEHDPTPPQPPAALDDELVEALESHDSETLLSVAEYALSFAEWKESAAADASSSSSSTSTSTSTSQHPPSEPPSESPPSVPERAAVSVVEIAGERYRYYQWREDDEIKSETVRLADE
ncbi:uncharacterized protein Nmag_3381 [Natrialba magadii ATCC 43099]|uniref:Uncharacterized protein n=1 Tax=Natrialba magadii (strain ATCC 43099 / DSM 3394 / CCM 3739 / CIP 104546 / IAM 13178 / JCM 8861 / NBRC 102185 / NCIMB 2190 / MS3) TaxID=547559 RepID=D3ST64_NATMM|nr:hypothetical protein [Natrialba magadii]ADD06931.1 uncharacterized protein Nmag_3381 [Natrialba magadii ATCC 43099]ELY28445.1 hypothetical protein C500_13322 [Natrialba magadii ATCC 43099]